MATETIEHAEAEAGKRSMHDGIVIAGAGAVTGLVGGLLMLALILSYTAGLGMGVHLFPRAVAALFYDVDALVGGAGVVTLGYVVHFVAAMLWGIVFAWLIRPDTTLSGAFAWAVAYGVGVWLFMTYAALPILNPVLGARVLLMPVAWLIGHLFFAVGLSFAPRLRRMVSRMPLRPPERVRQRGPVRTEVPTPAHG
jgi:hypothetical protein